MKFLPLIWAGLWRRPVRSVLTALSIVVAFTLLGLLEGVNAGFASAIANAHRDFLITDTRVRGGAQMPIAAMARIAALPGVRQVAQRAYFMGVYREPAAKNTLAAIATVPDLWFQVRPGFVVAPDHLAAMREHRNGLLSTPPMLEYFGWKIGDVITVRSQTLKIDGSGDWQFRIVGTFDTESEPTTTGFGLINYAYLDEYRVADRGTAERFYVRISDPNRAVATAAAIDSIFANSSHETRTRSDQARAEAQAKQMGDVRFFTNAIMASVLFTLAFLTGNTLRQSFQERTAEFAVLKVMGYSGAHVLTLSFAEALLLYLPPAMAGLLIARALAPFVDQELGRIVISPAVAVAGILCAAALALLSAAIPAWQLSRAPIAASVGRR
ncbi:MAG TPA: ABC transporter permease [Povalibacter sp.]|uniref:ABC transporter permease n=1 Tax=Povalibacter sp. TaxID=1962978 RepID=UPI002B50D55A|nr:FtsX-like permease family protein [Povalibacter sp.]HMN45194.1 ABC transporter permease [Povalibacter sp.]